jgi:hypothetical protein
MHASGGLQGGINTNHGHHRYANGGLQGGINEKCRWRPARSINTNHGHHR